MSVAFAAVAVRPSLRKKAFDGGLLSSNGGLLLLRGAARRLGLAARLARCIKDRRNPESILHTVEEMLRTPMFAIAAGMRLLLLLEANADGAASARGPP
jgi:hypothetical protein